MVYFRYGIGKQNNDLINYIINNIIFIIITKLLDSANNNYSSYDKVKHLVEINDNILAVFVVNSSNQMEGIHIAKNAGIDKSTIEQIFTSILIPDIESKAKYSEKNLYD